MVNVEGQAPGLPAVLWVLHTWNSHVGMVWGQGRISSAPQDRAGINSLATRVQTQLEQRHMLSHNTWRGEHGCVDSHQQVRKGRSVHSHAHRHGKKHRPTNVHSMCYIHVHVHTDTCSWGQSRDMQVLGGVCLPLSTHPSCSVWRRTGLEQMRSMP